MNNVDPPSPLLLQKKGSSRRTRRATQDGDFTGLLSITSPPIVSSPLPRLLSFSQERAKNAPPPPSLSMTTRRFLLLLLLAAAVVSPASGEVYSPCEDTEVKKAEEFTFGLAFENRESFYRKDGVQLSPCDPQLQLPYKAQVAVFRPSVDEISLLSVNATSFASKHSGTHMVAFAGRKYAARSLPIFVGNYSYAVTSFTLVLEFHVGILQNLYWKEDGCTPCSTGSSTFVCLNDSVCALPTSQCRANGGSMDCNLGIQLAFSGTDKNYGAFNSWYEVSKLRQYSLYTLFTNLKDSVFNQFTGFFG